MSYLTKILNEINEKKERRFIDIWDNIIKEEKQSKEHYLATCIYCY